MACLRSLLLPVFTVVAMTSLNGCYSSWLNTDAVERTNSALRAQEQYSESDSPLASDQLARLWRDKPDYVALANAPPPAKRMRLISAFPPKYPYLLHFHVEATVVVSFVVGKDGSVSDARVFESSDERFDASAIEAIMKFRWIAAEDTTGGPVSAMAHIPFHFKPKDKKLGGATDDRVH